MGLWGWTARGGTLTSLRGWGRGLALPGPSRCAVLPDLLRVKASHLRCQADEASPSPGGRRGARDLRARPGQCDTTHSCLSVVPEPGRLAGEEGGLRGGQRHLLPMPEPLSSQGMWERRRPVTQGLFPGKGHKSSSHCGWAWGQGDHGPLLHRLAGQDSAGLCPRHRRGFGGKIQVVALCRGLPWAGGRRATLRCCAHSAVRRHPWGRARRAAGAAAPRPPPPPPREDTGRGGPWRVGAEGSWTVAGLVAAGAKASGAPPGGWARPGPQEITIITK